MLYTQESDARYLDICLRTVLRQYLLRRRVCALVPIINTVQSNKQYHAYDVDA
jgi:hypothetical protein